MSTLGHAQRLEEVAAMMRGMGDRDAALDCTRAAIELRRLNGLINSPHVSEFLEAVRLEAAHQQERWGTSHDAGKQDSDWFWLVGFLAGKALGSGKRVEEALASDSVPDNDEAAAPHKDKRLHHIITTAAACLNWHAALTGANNSMRPGHGEEFAQQASGGGCQP